MKDEHTVNREIAALLMNLQATRSNSKSGSHSLPKPEDLSVKKLSNEAMDLSKSLSNVAIPQSFSKLAKSNAGIDLSNKTSKGSSHHATTQSNSSPLLPNFQMPSGHASYPFYQTLDSMASLSPSLAMNSNYLLQNLLLGKMHQFASASASTATMPSSSATVSKNSLTNVSALTIPASSLPTHPLPAQSLALQSPQSGPVKPLPAFKMSTAPTGSQGNSAPSFSNALSFPSGMVGENGSSGGSTSSSSIPLLCGQIVSQLNGLLFLIHGLNSSSIEINLHSQLSAIHSRLQDIVVMVEQTKNPDQDLKSDKLQKQKEEEKIVAKHIQDYQRALQKQQEDSGKATNGNHKTNYAALEMQDEITAESMELQEAESTSNTMSAAARRRRGRPPKNSNLDLSYSPPEKQSRSSQQATQDKLSSDHATQNADQLNGVVNGHQSNGNTSQGSNGQSGKGSKGIRNRVFCGECSGCLKNDDCGKCRYCKDKTKFGGQNRLRQKCLHRRCQMDNHRRKSIHNGQPLGDGVKLEESDSLSFDASRQSPSPNAIYSGVDLANQLRQKHTQYQQEQLEKGESGDQATGSETMDTSEEKGNSEKGDLSQAMDLAPKQPCDRSTSSASNGSATSDDDADDQKTGKSQSRIDKWKAKHEAMLKLAQKSERSSAVDRSSPDILGLDPSTAVCIDFDRKDVVDDTRHHSRHSTNLQHVLSV